jgi:hypothetical protein
MSDTDEKGDRVQKVLATAESLGLPPEGSEVRLVDPNEWLTQPQEMERTVPLDGIKLKIAALTEAETQVLMKQNTRPNPAKPQDPPRLDTPRFRLAVIAFSLNKAGANPPILPSQLESRKTGSLTQLQNEIMDLSGMATGAQPTADFFD